MSSLERSFLPPVVMLGSLETRPLPYRPLCKLWPTAEPAYWANREDRWRTKEFIDEHGRLYERERIGNWERWYLILEKVGDEGTILYRYDRKPPIEFGDASDRHEDFEFLSQVLDGLLMDAAENGGFGPDAMIGIQKQLKRLRGVLRDLHREIDILRPPTMDLQ